MDVANIIIIIAVFVALLEFLKAVYYLKQKKFVMFDDEIKISEVKFKYQNLIEF